MDITLSADSEKIVRHKLDSGMFSSPTDVVNAALSLLQQQERDWADKIEEGWNQALAGRFVPAEKLHSNLAARKAHWRTARKQK
jgi:Arc/MetJ-type ribon-helix-helix transcriptional regulator